MTEKGVRYGMDRRRLFTQTLLAIGIAFLVGALVGPAFGQGQQQPTGPGPGTTGPGTTGPGAGTVGPTTGRTTTPTTRSPFPEQEQRFPEMQRPIFLSGKVVLDDGTPPPDPVAIERLCHGRVFIEAYTDSKGRFSFEVGRNQHLFQDASIGSSTDPGFGGVNMPGTQSSSRSVGGIPGRGGVSERDLMGCELRASLPGFRSDLVNLAGRRMFDNPDVGTIVLRRLANVEGTTISVVAMAAPKDAKKSLDKARDLVKKKKPAEALKEYEKAVQIYPKYSTAWFELGKLHEDQNHTEEARKAYEQALAADPKYVNPYRQMARLAFNEQKWQDVADTTDRIIKLDPSSFVDAYFYNSVANYYLRKLDAAEKSIREVQKLDANHRIPKANHLLGAILIDKQDYSGAAEQLREFLKYAKPGEDTEQVKKQLEQLEKALSARTGQPQQ